ncbi:MAG: winged helix-turn-helix transcriptional regulator [Oscillospiraceae bacterium]|nr:winged helix-turn-helix transcriptional regulator [Oscillospiraceae bacterium]
MTQIIRDMLEISRCGVQYRSDNLAQFGLKSIHASYLTEICANPGISQDRLARIICINKSNVARQVAVLEEDGFVRRVPSEADKRVMELYPTEKTLELLPQISDILLRWEKCITQDLSEEEKETLSSLLGKMSSRASRYMEYK